MAGGRDRSARPARLRVLAGGALLSLALALFPVPAVAQTPAPQPAPGQPAAAPPAAAPAPVAIRAAGTEVNILADQFERIGGPQNLLIAIGNVELTRGNTRLLADRIELNQDSGDAVARGKVVFYDGQDRLVGDRIDYNIRTGTGVVEDGTLVAAPYYTLSGERLERLGENVYGIRRGTLTTCEGDDPAWYFRMSSATADMEDYVFGRDVSFWVKGVPVWPWFPFFAAAIRKERQSGFLLPTFGFSNERGFYAHVPFYWAINDSQDLTIALEAYSERGVGLTAHYQYILSERNRGAVTGFWLNEFVRSSDPLERAEQLARAELRSSGDNRAWVSGKHAWTIDTRTSFKVDVNATSDDDVFDDYGDLLSERGRERAETNIFVSRRWDAWNLVANILWYQDLTVRRPVELQRVPEVRLRGIRQPVPGLSPLLYEVESSLVNFMRHVGPEGLRVDVHPRLVLPIPIAGVVTVTPWVGGRLTYYDQRATGEHLSTNGFIVVEDSVTDHRVRQQVEVGVDAETRLSRVYTLDPGGRVAALQHVIEPRASVIAVRGLEQKAYPHYEPTVGRIGVLRSMDPNIDRLGKVNAVEYALTNRLNAKTTAGPGQEAVRWEAARLTVAQIYDVTRAIKDDEPFKDVRAEIEVRPTPAFSLPGRRGLERERPRPPRGQHRHRRESSGR